MLTDEQQRLQYVKYVEDNIMDVLKAKDLCVVAVEKDDDVLSVEIPGKDIKLVGNTDLLVMSVLVKKFPCYVNLLPGVRMLIEVKSDAKTNRGAISQALSKLIARDVLANDLVMVLLTNLTDYWEFFWVSTSNDHVSIKHVILTDPSSAFAMIRAILTQSPMADDSLATSDEISLPWLGEPVKRFKLCQSATILPFLKQSNNTMISRACWVLTRIWRVLWVDRLLVRFPFSACTRDSVV